MRARSAVFVGFLSVALSAQAFAAKFEGDGAHTVIGFKAATTLFDVTGWFDKYNLLVEGDPRQLGSVNVKLVIDVDSINTNNKARDSHLKNEDFFDAKKYPKITFTSNKASREGGKVVVHGTLDMHGVKKPMKIAFAEVSAKNGAGADETVYKAEFPLNRKDFGIAKDSLAAKISLADEVTIRLLIAGFFH